MAVTRLTTNGLTGTKYDIASADNYYMEPIATNLLASATSTITFSNIPNTYKHLQIRYMTLTGTATNDLRMRFNSDTGSNYVWHQLQGNGATAASAANLSQTLIAIGLVGGTANPGVGVVDILDYANTNKFKTTRALAGIDQNGSGVIMFWSGLWQNTSPVNSITFDSASGNFNTNTRISLYGIKG
jgi:hypothetical protein